MKIKYWLIWIIGTVIVLTLLFNLFSNPLGAGCTEIGCSCQNMQRQGSEISFTNITGERPCNTCTSGNPVFVSIVFNLVRYCEYKEIIICGNGEEIGQRYDKENKVCKYDPYILIFNLRFLSSYRNMISQPSIQANGTSFPGGK